jgi:hypothetical protein
MKLITNNEITITKIKENHQLSNLNFQMSKQLPMTKS